MRISGRVLNPHKTVCWHNIIMLELSIRGREWKSSIQIGVGPILSVVSVVLLCCRETILKIFCIFVKNEIFLFILNAIFRTRKLTSVKLLSI